MRFIRRKLLAETLGVRYNTTFKWERRGVLPPVTRLSEKVAGWPLDQLPEEWQPLFEADDPRNRQNKARSRAAQKAARTLAEAGA